MLQLLAFEAPAGACPCECHSASRARTRFPRPKVFFGVSEINARLTSRQTVSLSHATISVTVSSLVIGNLAAVGVSKLQRGGWLAAICCGLVALSWTFALWVRHNDATIGLLSAYCKALERIDDPDSKNGWPAWHNEDQQWILDARGLRRLSDLAAVVVTVVATSPSFVGCVAYFKSGNTAGGSTLVVSTVAGLLAIVFTGLNSGKRKQIASRCFEPDSDGVYMFRERKP